MINKLIPPLRFITTCVSLSVCRSSELGVLFLFGPKIFTQKPDCIFLNKQRLFRYFHPIPRTSIQHTPSSVPLGTSCLSYLDSAKSKAGIRVWASQKEKTNFGPVIRS